MRFTIASLLALVATATAGEYDPTAGFAVMTSPAVNENVPAGSRKIITWTPNNQYSNTHLTITLIGGPSAAQLKDIAVLATNVKQEDGNYVWTVDSTLGTETKYGIRIDSVENKGVFQWSNSFTISKSTSNTPVAPVAPLAPITPGIPGTPSSYVVDEDDVPSYPAAPSIPIATIPPQPNTVVRPPMPPHNPVVPGKNWTNNGYDSVPPPPPHPISTACHGTPTLAPTAAHPLPPTGTGSVTGRTATPTVIVSAAAPLSAAPFAVAGCLAIALLAI